MGVTKSIAMASMTGIMPAEDVAGVLKKIQRRKLRYAVFGFNDKRDLIITLEEQPPQCKESDLTMDIIREEWESMVEHLPPQDVRYVVYDFAFRDISSGYNDGDLEMAPIKSKLLLIQWSPDSAKPKVKMLVPASVASIQAECDDANLATVSLQLNSTGELMFESACDMIGVKLA